MENAAILLLTERLAELVEALKNSGQELMPFWTTLGGVLVGGLVTVGATLILDHFKSKQHSSIVEASILAEVAALLELIKIRNYLNVLDDTIAKLVFYSNGSDVPKTTELVVDVPAHYTVIYRSNCSSIGSLSKDKAARIVKFYQLIDSVVQDMKVGNPHGENKTAEHLEKEKQVLLSAISLGEALIGD